MAVLLLLNACEREERVEELPTTSSEDGPAETSEAAPNLVDISPLWKQGLDPLEEAQASAETFSTVLTTFLEKPSDKKLQTARTAWRNLAEKLQAFFVYAQLAKLAPKKLETLAVRHFSVAAWPVQPGFLDGFGPYPFSGMVNDVGIPLTAETLRAQHGMTDDSDVSLGIYAIEFLLFGERNLRGHLAYRHITGLSEAMQGKGYGTAAELPQNRRRELLNLQTALLLEDIAQLVGYWQQGPYGKIALHDGEDLTQVLIQQSLLKQAQDIKFLKDDPLTNSAELRNWRTTQLAMRLQGQTRGMIGLEPLPCDAMKKGLVQLEQQYAALAKTPAADWTNAALALQQAGEACEP